jgi:hypothetical protein
MKIWIEGENRSTLKPVAICLIFSLGFFLGLGFMEFIMLTDKILVGL